MNEYNKAQIDYREGCKSRIKRQMEISKIIVYILYEPMYIYIILYIFTFLLQSLYVFFSLCWWPHLRGFFYLCFLLICLILIFL